MNVLPPWKIRIMKKRRDGYETTFEATVPGHKLTASSAKNLARVLYLKGRNATFDEIVDAYLVRHQPQGYLTAASEARGFVDTERGESGFSCGCSECIVGISQPLTAEQTEFLSQELRRVQSNA